MPEKYQNFATREIKSVEFQTRMTTKLMNEWAERIPTFPENDPEIPEWKETPTIQLDLRKHGYGLVDVKDESQNPTGTIKDRPAWELATLYRDFARGQYLKLKAGYTTEAEINRTRIPTLTLITNGNEGHAVATMFSKYQLPPPRLLVGADINPAVLEKLKQDRANIYQSSLEKQLSAQEIKHLTGDDDAIDITSLRYNSPERVYYDWHVHEAFNRGADDIYVPYGSARLMANYLFWQARSFYGEKPDPRLKIDVAKLVSTSILGAEPKYPSIADKLASPYKPFIIYDDNDVNAARNFSSTGKNSGKYLVSDESIQRAQNLLQASGIQSEPSAAASPALYIDRFEMGETNETRKSLIINTGKGLTSEDHEDAIYNSESVN